jgi:hypothetical protein
MPRTDTTKAAPRTSKVKTSLAQEPREETTTVPATSTQTKTTTTPQIEDAPDAPQWFSGMMRQGWISVVIWMLFGLLLEGFLGYKFPNYLNDAQRRELFRLAHTHGTFLGLLLIAAALYGQRSAVPLPRISTQALRLGALLMPLGFLLGGIWHSEGDPGPGIWLVAPSALLVIFGAINIALVSHSKIT